MPSEILEALKVLSLQCDGAESEDGRGFSKPDSHRMKYWATLESLTPGQAYDAWWRLRKYTAQLAKLGIDYAAIPQPANADLKAADLLRPAVGRNRTKDADSRIIRTTEENKAFTFAWPYSDVAKLLQPLKDHFPVRAYKRDPFPHWQIPANAQAARLMEFAMQYEFDVSEEACALFDSINLPDEAEASEAPKLKHPDRIIRQDVDKKGKEAIGIYFGYVPAIYSEVKELEGAQFHDGKDGSPKHWTCKYESAAEVLKMAAEFEFTIEPSCKVRLEQNLTAKAEADTGAKRRKLALLEAAKDIPNGSFGGKTPRDYQTLGVSFLLNAQRAILADDMGLGKTLEATLWARCYQRAFSAHVFVVCPVSLRGGWQKEAEACGVRCEIYSWAKVPPPPSSPFVAIFDEAHYGQSLKASRTKAMLELTASSHCLGVVLASGTPMRGGRPANLFPLLKAINHPIASRQKDYERTYCNARLKDIGRGKTVWDTTGAAHLDDLMRKISDVFLRRTKEQVLKDLPAKTLIIKPIEISADGQAIYKKAFDEAQAKYNAKRLATEQRIKAAAAAGKAYEFTKEDAQEGGEELVLLTHLRRAASLAKAEPAIEMADEILEQGRQVILFTEFADSAKTIAANYRKAGIQTELLTGETKPEERQPMVDRFQAGQSRVWVSTIKAGGVGLTLTAASDVILLDQAWMIDDCLQAGDRAHRIGQKNAVTVYWLRGFEVDAKIQARLIEQQDALKKVMSGDRSTMRGVKSINQIAAEIARELFSENGK